MDLASVTLYDSRKPTIASLHTVYTGGLVNPATVFIGHRKSAWITEQSTYKYDTTVCRLQANRPICSSLAAC